MRSPLRFQRVPSEHDEQVAAVQWWDLVCSAYKLPTFALYAIPNAGAGAQRGQAGKMKAEGVRKGVPDLCLAVPRGKFHGLYIEMKRREGSRTSMEQLTMMAFLLSQRYEVDVCDGADEAIDVIKRYLA